MLGILKAARLATPEERSHAESMRGKNKGPRAYFDHHGTPTWEHKPPGKPRKNAPHGSFDKHGNPEWKPNSVSNLARRHWGKALVGGAVLGGTALALKKKRERDRERNT